VLEAVLGWSAREARLLSGGGVAEAAYSKERGFPFRADELPHYHLRRCGAAGLVELMGQCEERFPLVGAYARPLLVGGLEWSRESDVVNVQTSRLFVDVRIPTQRDAALNATNDPLRVLARQHAFAGFTRFRDGVATRHHLLDWNFLGASSPRNRPNKWRVQQLQGTTCWKESSFVQPPYYLELWQQLNHKTDELALASADGTTVVCRVGEVFAYAQNRRTLTAHGTCADAFDRDREPDYLHFLAGHGLSSSDGSFVVHRALQPEHQGLPLSDVIGVDLNDLPSSLSPSVGALTSPVPWRHRDTDFLLFSSSSSSSSKTEEGSVS